LMHNEGMLEAGCGGRCSHSWRTKLTFGFCFHLYSGRASSTNEGRRAGRLFFLKIVNNTQFIVHLVLIFVSQLIVGAGTCRCDPEDAPTGTDGRRWPQGNDGIGPRRMCSWYVFSCVQVWILFA
jgi:hypothetical protein